MSQGIIAVETAMAASGEVTDGGGLATMVGALVDAMVGLHAEDRKLHQVLFDESPRPAGLLERLRVLEHAAVEGVADMLESAGVGGDAR